MLRKFQPPAILAFGWFLFLVYAHPGTLTFDSIDVLIQARAGIYRDDHPPTVAALWRLVEHVVPGPYGMLVLQSIALLVGFYLIFRKTLAPRGAAIAATALLLFPPVMMPMTAIWKDPLMAGFFILGIGALLVGKRRWTVLGIVAISSGAAMRFNAPAATLAPIVLLFDWGFLGWRRYALSTVVWLATTFAVFGVNAALVDRQTYAWNTTFAVHDIVGTLARIDSDIPDAKLEELLAGSDLLVHHDIHATARAIFNPRDYLTPITDPQHAFWHFSLQNDWVPSSAYREAMARTWTYLVEQYPIAFTKHRLAQMDLVLDGESAIPWRGEAQRELRAGMGLPNGSSELQLSIYRKLVKFERRTHMFTPWVYFLVALVLLTVAWRERDVLALLLSGLMYELTFLVFSATRDYRYSHWLIVTCCIAVVTLTARRARAKVRA